MSHLYILHTNATMSHTKLLKIQITDVERCDLISAIGCADLATPPHTWHKRAGDVTTVGCEHQTKTWQLKCEGSQWRGVVGTCNATGKL